MQPIIESMVICEGVHRDNASGKMTLLGTFNVLNLKEFPGATPGFAVYIVISGMRGPTSIRLSVTRTDESGLEDHLVVQSGELKFDGSDPVLPQEMVAAFQNVELAQPGVYRIGVVWNNEIIHHRKLFVRHMA